eukprot:scaffold3852_cov402-Prasinococcus_capsulatus_cf.AAC.7
MHTSLQALNQPVATVAHGSGSMLCTKLVPMTDHSPDTLDSDDCKRLRLLQNSNPAIIRDDVEAIEAALTIHPRMKAESPASLQSPMMSARLDAFCHS